MTEDQSSVRSATPLPATSLPAPGARLDAATMPAHWLLARLGKKVMRPGGLPVTRAMLAGLAIGPEDDVVDLAPGLGVTVGLVHAARPASFRGLERSEVEAERARRFFDAASTEPRPAWGRGPMLGGARRRPGGGGGAAQDEGVVGSPEDTEPRPAWGRGPMLGGARRRPGGGGGAAQYHCVVARPEDTGLAGGSASVVYGEAVLSLETDATKDRIVAEAARLLRPGGCLGLHELLLRPDDLPEPEKRAIEGDLTRTLRVRARPLTLPEWKALLERGGFDVEVAETAPLLLLSPPTFVRDEGIGGTVRFVARTVRQPVALKRLSVIWNVFRRYQGHLGAVALVARKR